MQRIVVDTGIVISAIAFGGIPSLALKLVFTKYQPIVSPALLKEYRWVPAQMLKKGKITDEQFKVLVVGIAEFVSKSKLVIPSKKLILCRDPKDDMILECCFEASAIVLLTGDKDLLEIDRKDLKGSLPNLRILTSRLFLKEYE